MNQSDCYSPALDMESRINNLIVLLQDPNNESPANGEASRLWGTPAFTAKVKEWAKQINRF